MSQTGTQTAAPANTAPQAANTLAPATAPVAPLSDELQAALSAYNKRGKARVLYNEGDEARAQFLALVQAVAGEAGEGFKDWTENAPESFKSLAIVHQEHTGNDVVIAMPDRDTLFADPSAAGYLYRLAINKIINTADSEDATEARFIVPGGCFTQRFDVDAYRFQQKGLVKSLHNVGIKSITVGGLKDVFASAAFASTAFPRVPAEFWDNFLDVATAYAESKGYDTSLFAHWKATRHVVEDTGVDFELEELMKGITPEAIDEARNVQQTDAETKPATEGATA
jgi:hypothetical protein